jgi:hypothetical protein
VVTLAVSAKTSVADGVATLELVHPDGKRLPDWTPGAHIDLVLPNGLSRQYSLCGDRWDAHTYRVGVLREVSGRGGSAYVHDELRAGDLVGIGGPRNNFPMVPAHFTVLRQDHRRGVAEQAHLVRDLHAGQDRLTRARTLPRQRHESNDRRVQHQPPVNRDVTRRGHETDPRRRGRLRRPPHHVGHPGSAKTGVAGQ